MVPGGARSEKAWAELVGVAPDKGAAFFERLVEKDDGWLASYYDSLARINGPVQAYLTEPERIKRFYLALRGKSYQSRAGAPRVPRERGSGAAYHALSAWMPTASHICRAAWTSGRICSPGKGGQIRSALG